MAESSSPTPDDTARESADASWLLQGHPPAPKPVDADRPEEADDSSGSYDVAGIEPEVDDAPAAPIPVVVPPPRPKRPAARRKPAESDDEPTVDPVWSRLGEWGPDLGRIALAGSAGLFITFILISGHVYFPAFLVLLATLAATGLLAYPILITLERPVRVTPEQAAKDYYGALSHLIPHYRRMWLLLTSEGRAAAPFGDFEAFREYWQSTMAAWGDGRPSRFSAWRFEVSDFKSEKSAGQTVLDVEFTVSAIPRAEDQSALTKTFRVSTRTVKGPDRMWYLEQGSLSVPSQPSAVD